MGHCQYERNSKRHLLIILLAYVTTLSVLFITSLSWASQNKQADRITTKQLPK